VVIEDIAVPVPKLAAAMLDLQQLFVEHGYDEAIMLGHALEGNVHFVFTPDFGREEEVERYRAFMDAVERMSEKLSATITSAKAVMDRYRSLDRKRHRIEAKELRMKFRELRQELSRDLKTWRRLCRLILKLEPVVFPAS